MKRTVTREKRLPANVLSLDDVALLVARIKGLFPDGEEVNPTIAVELGTETLRFESAEELSHCSDLPATVTRYKIEAWGRGKFLTLRSQSFAGGCGNVNAQGENEAWCAGGIDTVVTFFKARQPSYGWLFQVPVGWISYAAVCAFLFASFSDVKVTPGWGIAWGVFALVTLAASLFKGTLSPSVIEIRQMDGFVKRHSTLLMFLVSTAALAVAIIGLFVKR